MISNEIASAIIAVGGVVVAGILQWLVTLLVIRSERRKLQHQLAVEFRAQHFTAWQHVRAASVSFDYAHVALDRSARRRSTAALGPQ
jgi:hypothetical protein